MADDNKLENSTRRRFVKGAGLGLITAGAMPTVYSADSSQTRSTKTDYDVIVAGGGFAGVTAARECRQRGYQTLLLEARDRLGGRTHTAEFAGHKVELGGTWIHWSQPFVWAEKERYGLDVIETPGAVPERMLLAVEGKVIALDEQSIAEVAQGFSLFMAEARTILPLPYDVRASWDEVLKADAITAADHLARVELTPLQHTVLDSFIGAIAHNSTDSISYLEALRWTALAGYGDMGLWMDAAGRYQLADGTDALLNAILADGQPDVHLFSVVQRVTQGKESVQVSTRQGKTFTARAVVMALPNNVVADIEYQPPLNAGRMQAAQERISGVGAKVFIRAKGRLGRVSMLADTSHPLINTFTYKEAQDHTVLVGFGTGQHDFDCNDAQAVQAALSPFLPGIEVEQSFAYDWRADPFAKGTWASYPPGWMRRFHADLAADQGRLFFAQGDHGDGWRGFIDGAIGGGIKAAQRIATKLG